MRSNDILSIIKTVIVFSIILWTILYFFGKENNTVNREITKPIKVEQYKSQPCLNSEGVPIECKG